MQMFDRCWADFSFYTNTRGVSISHGFSTTITMVFFRIRVDFCFRMFNVKKNKPFLFPFSGCSLFSVFWFLLSSILRIEFIIFFLTVLIFPLVVSLCYLVVVEWYTDLGWTISIWNFKTILNCVLREFDVPSPWTGSFSRWLIRKTEWHLAGVKFHCELIHPMNTNQSRPSLWSSDRLFVV